MEKGLRGLGLLPWSALDLLSTSNESQTVLSMLIGLMMIQKIALVSRKTHFIGIKRLSSLMEKIYDCESLEEKNDKSFPKNFYGAEQLQLAKLKVLLTKMVAVYQLLIFMRLILN